VAGSRIGGNKKLSEQRLKLSPDSFEKEHLFNDKIESTNPELSDKHRAIFLFIH